VLLVKTFKAGLAPPIPVSGAGASAIKPALYFMDACRILGMDRFDLWHLTLTTSSNTITSSLLSSCNMMCQKLITGLPSST